MKSDNTSAKGKIFQAALELVTSEENVENITLRQIAKKADVNLALINYYYQSKENLLNKIVEIEMANIINQVLEKNKVDVDATMKLKDLLITTADFAFKFYKIWRIAVSGELKQGCRNSCEMIMPVLKEIYKNNNESELRIIALQLLLPFHHIVLYPEIYNEYLKTDFFNDQKRAHKINQMIDSILQQHK